MSPELIIAAVSGTIIGVTAASLIYRRVPKKLKTNVFISRWKEIQNRCKDKQQWQQALIEADELLDIALRRRKYKGKTRGERMVSAQRIFTNNDATWFAHNLYKKVLADPTIRLKEADMKTALTGFRQALKDLGALSISEEPKKGEA